VPLLEFTLLDGTHIWASAIHGQQTYAHVYEGLPNASTNDGYLANFPGRITRIFNGPLPVHVIPPERLEPHEPHPMGGTVELLPEYWFAAEFYGAGMRTVLAVVWFQREPVATPSDAARRNIERLDWSRLAEEFNP
jgi:hypothetical protein